jgi:hypothetical protein
MPDQHKRLILVGLFECDSGVTATGPMHEGVTNVAIGIARAVVRVGRDGRLHPAREFQKPGQHGDSLRPFSGDALNFSARELEANRKLRCQPIAVCHDDQDVPVRLVEVE